MSPDGLLVVDKPAGMTSHDVVAKVRRLAGTKKVGHAGTLDPMATGVLLLGLGKATRLLGHLTLAEKTYAATLRLGLSTTTDDAEGEPLSRRSAAGIDEELVRARLLDMRGELDQVPSAVSAVKVDGRRSHERVRAGEQVELAPRRVWIHELHVLDVRPMDDPEGGFLDVEVIVRCSSGTYIRAIARDLGQELRVGGHLTRLRRTAIGAAPSRVDLDDASTLAELTDQAGDQPLPLMGLGRSAQRFFSCVSVGEDQARDVGFGRRLTLHPAPEPHPQPVAVLDGEGRLLALYRRVEDRADGTHAPLAVLV